MSTYQSNKPFSMPSKFAGTCPWCFERYAAGTPITKRDGRWGHAQCGTTANSAGRIAQQNTAPSTFSARKSIIDAQPSAADVLSAIAASLADSTSDAPAAEVASVTTFKASKFQAAIFDWLVFGTGHGVVEAVAGSGKTTTCVQAVRYLPLAVALAQGKVTSDAARAQYDGGAIDPSLDALMSSVDVGFVAFNKHIAQQLSERMPDWCYTATLHSLGYADLKQALGHCEIDEDARWNRIFAEFDDFTMPKRWSELSSEERTARRVKRNNLKKLTSLAKATITDYNDPAAVLALIDHYGLDLNGDLERLCEVLPTVMALSLTSTSVIDFEDMQYLPVALSLPCRQFDYLFVDEAQDLNACQAAFILRSLKPTGRIIAVGDRKQSLYGFRGADVDALQSLIAKLSATVLPLSISYRCPSSHIKLAQEIVPQIIARDNAPEGAVADMTEAQMAQRITTGDLVICRTNAPLVPVCFALIRKGVKATIRGKDIGKGLSDLAKKLADGAERMEDFFAALSDYSTNELRRLEQRNAPETQITALTDKVDTLYAVAGECNRPIDVSSKIESIFSDENGEIVLSSVHRAKGLESTTVWIVKPELMPFPKVKQQWEMEQEMNIKYVALTRSKENLFFVR